MKLPELAISHRPDGAPSAALCSLCGTMMAVDSPRPCNPQDAITAFAEQFKIHIREKHPQFAPP
jgi:hypothetical protein